jgi:hypothetical protein
VHHHLHLFLLLCKQEVMPLLLLHIHTLLLMLLECGSELDALLLSHLEVKHGLILNFGVVLLLERYPMLLLH